MNITIITNGEVLDVVGLPDSMTYTIEKKPDLYNGWTNYPTWRVNLEIFDGINWGEEVEDGINYDGIGDFVDDLKERAQEAVTHYGDIAETSLAVSYATAFLDDVNFHEIAKHIVEDYPKLLK